MLKDWTYLANRRGRLPQNGELNCTHWLLLKSFLDLLVILSGYKGVWGIKGSQRVVWVFRFFLFCCVSGKILINLKYVSEIFITTFCHNVLSGKEKIHGSIKFYEVMMDTQLPKKCIGFNWRPVTNLNGKQSVLLIALV